MKFVFQFHFIELTFLSSLTYSNNLPDGCAQYEKELIERAVEQANGNYAKTSRLFKISKQTLYNK